MDVHVTFLDRKPVELSRRQIIKGLAAGYIVAVSGCVENQMLGRQQLMLVSDSQIVQLSAATWTQIRKEKKVSTNRTLNRRLGTVGPRIVQAAGLQNRNWEYTVMGHETGHVAARHSAERYSQQMAAGVGMQAAQVALQAGDVSGASAIASVLGAGLQFGILLPYSRQHELEADRLGVNYMAQAGYDPRQSLRFWKNMSAQQGRNAPPPEFMSTHPSDATRMAALQQQLRAMGYQV